MSLTLTTTPIADDSGIFPTRTRRSLLVIVTERAARAVMLLGAVLVGLLAGVPWIAATLNATDHIASWNYRSYCAMAAAITAALLLYSSLANWVVRREAWT